MDNIEDRFSRLSQNQRELFFLICEHFDKFSHNEIKIDEESDDIVCAVCGVVIREGKLSSLLLQ